MSYTFQYAEVLELKRRAQSISRIMYTFMTAAEASISRSMRRMTRCACLSPGTLRSAA